MASAVLAVMCTHQAVKTLLLLGHTLQLSVQTNVLLHYQAYHDKGPAMEEHTIMRIKQYLHKLCVTPQSSCQAVPHDERKGTLGHQQCSVQAHLRCELCLTGQQFIRVSDNAKACTEPP